MQTARNVLSLPTNQAESILLDPAIPFHGALADLMGYAAEFTRLGDVEAHADRLQAANFKLLDQTKALTDANAELDDLARHHKAEFEKLGKHHAEQVEKARVLILRLETMNNAQDKELKELRALNPKRLVKQNKELQKKNRALTDSLAASRKNNSDTKKQQAENIRLNKALAVALTDLKSYDAALKQASADISAGNVIDPLWEDKTNGWAIFPADVCEALVIHDVTLDATRAYRNQTGITKARPVPQSVKTQAQALIDRHMKEEAYLLQYAADQGQNDALHAES